MAQQEPKVIVQNTASMALSKSQQQPRLKALVIGAWHKCLELGLAYFAGSKNIALFVLFRLLLKIK